MSSEFGFEPRSPRYGLFLVLGLMDRHRAQSGQFLAIFRPFLGHIVELEGKKGLFVTGKSRRTLCVATVFLRLAFLHGFQGRFGPKKAVLGHKMRSIGRAASNLATAPGHHC